MRGTNHILTGLASVVTLDTYLKVITKIIDTDVYNHVHDYFAWHRHLDITNDTEQICVTVLAVILNSVLFLIGCLLPDIDQEKSTMGKIMHLPVKHRTWTHTIWAVVLFAAISCFLPCMTFLTFGYILHIFFDSLSKGGICWFYPLSQYKTWTSGAQVKKNHKLYLYRTGETSETLLTAIIVFIGALALTYNILLTAGVTSILPFHAG